MLHEHAITYHQKITVAELNYLAMKANKLGKAGRDILRVHEETDDEGTHVYFDVTGMTNGQRAVSQEVQ